MSTVENNKEKKKEDILALPMHEPIEVECMEGELDIVSDFEEYLDQKYVESITESSFDDEAYAAWWARFLYNLDGYQKGDYDDDGDDYDDLPFGEQVFPYDDKDDDGRHGSLKPQRFVNGIEIDDDVYGAFYGKRSKNHRKISCKHQPKIYRHKKRRYEETSYYDDMYDEDSRKIVFHRDLSDEDDTYEWDNVFEFNEWLQENNIFIKDSDASYILNNTEVHCCLDPATSDKALVTDRSFGDLIWTLTGADADLIKEYSQKQWNI